VGGVGVRVSRFRADVGYPRVVHRCSFSEPAGMADLITSCYSGRNKKCAEIFAKTGESWEKIEKVRDSVRSASPRNTLF